MDGTGSLGDNKFVVDGKSSMGDFVTGELLLDSWITSIFGEGDVRWKVEEPNSS